MYANNPQNLKHLSSESAWRGRKNMAEIKKLELLDSNELYSKGSGWVRVTYTGLEEPHEIICEAINVLKEKDPNGPGIRAIIPHNIANKKTGGEVQQFEFECELTSRDCR